MVITVLKSSFTSLERANKDYDSFEDAFMKTHKRDAEMKKKFVRANEAPYITKKTNYENV